MVRTKAEIKGIAEAIVNRIVADIIFDNPGIKKAVDKLSKDGEWASTLDSLASDTEEILLNKFGCSD